MHRLLSIAIAVLFLCAGLVAAPVYFSQDHSGYGLSCEIVENSYGRLVLDFELISADTGDVNINGEDCHFFHIPGLAYGTDSEQPELFSRNLLVATGDEPRIDIEYYRTEQLNNFKLAPRGYPKPDVHGYQVQSPKFDDEIYGNSNQFPDSRVEYSNQIVIRGVESRRIKVFPAVYFSDDEILDIAVEFRVTIDYRMPDPVPANLATPRWRKFLPGLFVNGDLLEFGREIYSAKSPTGADFLIITDPIMQEAAESLAVWKTLCGLDTEVKLTTETGTSAAEIQTYIETAYSSWSPAPEFLLILGDAENVIPVYSSDHPYHGTPTGTDLYYATVDGSDYYPDIFYGRISAQSQDQAMDIVRKILDYERVSHDLGSSFYNSVGCAAYFQDGDRDGYADRRFALTSEEIYSFLDSEGYDAERLYVTEASVTPTNWNNGTYSDGSPIPTELLRSSGFAWDAEDVDVKAAIDEGVFLLSHRDHGFRGGWGDPAYDKVDVGELSNLHKLPLVMSFNCASGHFDNETDGTGLPFDDECFCESFIRKYPGGAIGIIGATRVSYSGYNDYMARGFIDGMWDNFDTGLTPSVDTDHRAGAALAYGKIYMEEMWDEWVLEFEIFQYNGDPSMRMFTGVPSDITADLPSSINDGMTSLAIDCPDDGGLACAVIDGEIVGRALVSGGTAVISLDGIMAGDTIQVTITDHNKAPFMGIVPVMYAAHTTVTPGTLDVLVADIITVEVLDTLDAPYPGVTVYINGFALAETLVTDATGYIEYPIVPSYAETLTVIGERPEGGVIFRYEIPVIGGSMFEPVNIELSSPTVLVEDSLAVGVEGFIRAELPSSPFFWRVYGSGIGTLSGNVASGDTVLISVNPISSDDIWLETAKEGFAVGRVSIQAEHCYGPLDGRVRDSTGAVDADEIDIFVYHAGADTSIEDPNYTIKTNPAGYFNAGEFVPVGDYDFYPFGFGWEMTNFTMTHDIEGDYDIRIPRAQTSPLSGEVTDISGNPVQAEVVLLHPGGMQLRRTSSDVLGSYSVSAIPYFDYKIAVFARGYQTYFEDLSIFSAPTSYDIELEPVEQNVLLIDNHSESSADSLESHIESFGLSVRRVDYVPALDTLKMYEFVVYSTGGNSTDMIIDLTGAWRLLEGHRNGVKILFEGGDLARQYIESSSMTLVYLDSLLMVSAYHGANPDTSLGLNVAPSEAYALANNPDTPPRSVEVTGSIIGQGYFDIVTPYAARILYYIEGTPSRSVVNYFADSAGAGVHRMAHMYFKYDDALAEPGVNKVILRNIVEWLRAPDFSIGVLAGRCVVVGGSDGPRGIEVSGGSGVDTTQEDGRFVLRTDPGMFHMYFSGTNIKDTTHYGITLAPGEVRVGYVAILSWEDAIPETDLPHSFDLESVHPNPFNSAVKFDIHVPKTAEINVEIFDMLGRRIFDQNYRIEPGDDISWDPYSVDAPSGVYLYRISDGNTRFKGKLLLLR